MAGRKPGYMELVEPRLFEIKMWAREGLIDKEIAARLGIGVSTLYDYKKLHQEFSDALKEGKAIADYRVEEALYKRAMGFDYEETTEEMNKDGKMVVTKRVTKHVPSDTASMIFFLKNRRPDLWRDRMEVKNENENSGEMTLKFADPEGSDKA